MSFPGPQMRNRNPFDDRNRDTFGDDFVYHHVQEQRQIRDNKHLITPGNSDHRKLSIFEANNT